MPEDPSWSRRYSLPFEGGLNGAAKISPYADLDRTLIESPHGGVTIGAARLVQCVVVEPITIEDNVQATAAILGGYPGGHGEFETHIGFGTIIEAHADVQGYIGENVIIRRGAKIRSEATIGDDVELMDRCYIGSYADIEEGAVIGVGATVGDSATVHANARVPAGANIPPGSYWHSPTERQAHVETVGLYLVDEDQEPEPEPMWAEDDEDDWGSRDMVRGRPILELQDFNPGTSRSWVLTKLARTAARTGIDSPITKQAIRRDRPDLLDHPVTKEVLRMQPPPTAVDLNEMSWGELSDSHYDVYTGIRFNAGDTQGWQMLTEDDNDVFVLAVPPRIIDEINHRLAEDYPELGPVLRHEMQDALFPRVEWHPDRDVPFPVGWVRTILYPRQTVVVVEIQSDRPWMMFDWRPEEHTNTGAGVMGNILRDMYFESFASDALNIVVEWAFSRGYNEVLVLDRKSRKKLGGTPPKMYYETVPKQYSVTGPQPLPPYIKRVYWLQGANLRARRIRPNPKLV